MATQLRMRKFTLETSKKMLPTPWTFTRAVVVFSTGTLTACEPSFGVLAIRVVGNVSPPSVDRRMATFAVLMGAAVVPATSQVTVSVPPDAHATLVFGAVTRNGPAADWTETVV